MKRISHLPTPSFLAIAILSAVAACSSSSNNATSNTDGGAPGNGNNNGDGSDTSPGNGSDGGNPGSATDDGGGTPGQGLDASTTNPKGLSALQLNKGEMLTSIWENATTIFNYAYAINLNDGCGYTSGRVGFCTGTGDALLVVQCYDTAFGTGAQNLMAKYVPALQALATKQQQTGQSQADTSTIDKIGKYTTDWATSATNATTMPDFNGCQDQIVYQEYVTPALAETTKWGLTQPLSIVAMYDAEVNHGEDGVDSLITQTNKDVGNTAQKVPTSPMTLTQESTWLQNFLAERVKVCAASSAWDHAVDRVAQYEVERQAANWDLSATITTNAKAKTVFSNASYIDGGYPACIIAPDGTVSGDPECTTPAN